MMSSTAASATKGKRVAKKTEDVVVAPAAVAVAAPAVVAAAAPATKGRKPAAAKAAVAAVTPVVAAPAVVAEPVADAAAAVAPAAPATTLDEDLKAVLATLTTLREQASAAITEVKRLDKRVHKDMKDARKRKRRVRAEGEEAPKRGPSIFEIPTKVTDELCKFLKHPAGTLISRSNVTKQINNYVKENNLKNKHDITPDAPLRKLLQVPETDQLTYFNLQRYLNRHYIKTEKVAPVATA
jgi:hypothetical protein